MKKGIHLGSERVSSVVGKEKSADIQAFMERHDMTVMILFGDADAIVVGNVLHEINPEPLPAMLRNLAEQIEAKMMPAGDEVH